MRKRPDRQRADIFAVVGSAMPERNNTIEEAIGCHLPTEEEGREFATKASLRSEGIVSNSWILRICSWPECSVGQGHRCIIYMNETFVFALVLQCRYR
jgi:hypothetical protein